ARRAAGAVVAVQLPGLRVPDDGEQVAADAVAGRLHQAEGGIGGDGGIHGAAAAAHGVQGDLGGQRVRGGSHGLGREHFRARGEGLAGNAVGTHGGSSGEGGGEGRQEGKQRRGAEGRRAHGRGSGHTGGGR